ncbi:glutamine amidotransferase-related protein [Bacterioplanoides pacificum]|uniref:Glutamine amidotransferase domain-containing protein n=1 Tax=Bacterioplanoides pacificum TaxID=1171596 RepID=A0ABV7VUB8_9GAMM
MLQLGILETDTLYADLQPDYQSYGHMFAGFFNRLGGQLNYRFYQVQQGELPAPQACDAYLITGSKSGVYDDKPWITALSGWIANAHQGGEKIAGICFGHQILAHSLGGQAGKSEKGWGIGVHTTAVTQHPGWLNDDTSHIRLIYSHQDQVGQLPATAKRLAGSEFCENAAFFIDQRVLAFQGHPEFTAQYLSRLLPRRAQAIGETCYQQGMNTLNQPTDSDRVGRWLLEFFQL